MKGQAKVVLFTNTIDNADSSGIIRHVVGKTKRSQNVKCTLNLTVLTYYCIGHKKLKLFIFYKKRSYVNIIGKEN